MSDTKALQLAVRAIEGFRAENARLQAALTEAQRRGDGYKGESETSFARARRAETALDGYKALAEKYSAHGSGCLARGWKRGDNEYRCDCGLDAAFAAIDATPEEAREKERR
jgi:hypothetical protein